MAGTVGSPKWYEYIVVGCGGVGSGALYWLAKRAGKKVLGLEQFKLGHEHGGSQDHSRIIRLMYNDERYTKLVPATYTAWEEVERESGVQLVWKTGALDVASKNSARAYVLEDYAGAMAKQNIPFSRITGAQIRQRFPQWKVGDDVTGLYQPDGGLVDAAMGNSVHVQLAQAHGATVLDNCPVLKVAPVAKDSVLVYTPQGVFSCRRLIVTSGAWINHVLGSVGVNIPITVTQEQVTYMATPHVKKFTKDNFPVFIYHDDRLDFYGLPIHGNSGSKIGMDAGGPSVTVDTRTYVPDPVVEKACIDFYKKYVPEAVGPVMYTKTCLYTMTHDRHFVIDDLSMKGMPQIVVCCGAGHAYKWASLLGKILSEMAVDGSTRYPIDQFSMNREPVSNLNSKPSFHVTYRPPAAKL